MEDSITDIKSIGVSATLFKKRRVGTTSGPVNHYRNRQPVLTYLLVCKQKAVNRGGKLRNEMFTGIRTSKSHRTMESKSLSILTGSPLTLDCSVDTALNYCWFKHPNNTR